MKLRIALCFAKLFISFMFFLSLSSEYLKRYDYMHNQITVHLHMYIYLHKSILLELLKD